MLFVAVQPTIFSSSIRSTPAYHRHRAYDLSAEITLACCLRSITAQFRRALVIDALPPPDTGHFETRAPPQQVFVDLFTPERSVIHYRKPRCYRTRIVPLPAVTRIALHRHEALEGIHLLAYRVNRTCAGFRCCHRLCINLEHV